MQKCPNCGADVDASHECCKKCGAELDSKNNSSKLIIGIVIAVVIIAIAGAFASGIFTGTDSTDDVSQDTVEPVSEDTSESANTEYWASARAEKFHLPDCEWAQKISEDNKIIYDSREDAIADGKIPCGACNP